MNKLLIVEMIQRPRELIFFDIESLEAQCRNYDETDSRAESWREINIYLPKATPALAHCLRPDFKVPLNKL